jgi:hypothetical protein
MASSTGDMTPAEVKAFLTGESTPRPFRRDGASEGSGGNYLRPAATARERAIIHGWGVDCEGREEQPHAFGKKCPCPVTIGRIINNGYCLCLCHGGFGGYK